MTKRIMRLLVVLLSLCVAAGTAVAAPKANATLNPTNIPQFVDPLPLLAIQGGFMENVVYPDTSSGSLPIYMQEFKANILPLTIKLPNKALYSGTWVWGYRTGATAPTDPVNTYIGPVFVVQRGTPTQIQWVNALGNTATTNLTFWKLSTDQTLHWADPLSRMCSMITPPLNCAVAPNDPCCANYSGAIPAVVHLHGGEVPPQLDGGPDAWFTSDGAAIGHGYYSKDGIRLKNYATYRYPNTQEAAPAWFHDHALGITRLNVYAGLAGAYIITDNVTNPALPEVLNDPTRIVPIVIQDRMFDTTGQLFFPNVGINPEHPFWVPEFVGDVIVVNGKSWPFLNVGLNTYRFLFLNGSNARAYELDLFDRATGLPGPPMWVIGTDGGYLNNPVKLDPVLKQKLIIMPGERYEVVVDFSGGTAGQVLELRNTARTPYPGGATVVGSTTGRIMRFNVVATPPGNPPPLGYAPKAGDSLRTKTIENLTRNTPDKTRQLTLNEVMGPGGPLEVLVNNTKWSGGVDPISANCLRGDFKQIGSNGATTCYSELPLEGTTEAWEIVNLTADAHPIHLHLVQFQLIDRQNFNLNNYTAVYNAAFPTGMFQPAFGPPLDYNTGNGRALGGNPDIVPFLMPPALPPNPNEAGWKDTVITYPGQVTRIAVRWAPQDANDTGYNYFPFDPNGGHGYVWHCHIIDHEDNEMMRPTLVSPLEKLKRAYKKGSDY